MFSKFKKKTIVLAALGTVAALLSSACMAQPIQRPTPAAPPATSLAADTTGIGDNMRGLLARQLQVDPAAVKVAVVEPTEWPDACLGAGTPAEACAQVVTPGYIVTLRVDGWEYTYHTDPEGYQLRLVAAPETEITAPIITWTGAADNGSCQEALIGGEGVAFGLCGAPAKFDGKFVAAARQDILAEWAEQFASFAATTDFGQVTFVGSGAAVATPAEQQQIARWAMTVVMEAGGGESLAGLRYEGPAEIGSTDTSKCAGLQLGPSIEAGIGACDGTVTSKDIGMGAYLDWEYLRDHLAPFVYETDTERITFEGMGNMGGEAWQRAILAWARIRYTELSSGKVSAAASTALSWRLGPLPEQPESCHHLTVLAFGYAQAETRPCAGGDVLDSSNGWLKTAELEQLDRWVYERAALYAGDNYIAGVGGQPMSDAEAAAAEQWAADVWNRLAGGNTVVAPAACPVPSADTQLWVDVEQGYCLLYPSGYVAEQTAPDEVNPVLGSIMNHTDPRVAIAVEDAAGRTLAAVTAQLQTDYVPAGIEVEPGFITVDSVEAVMLDNLPGQDLNRRAAFIHNGRLYSLFFTPVGGASPLESFFQGILDSFRFLEETVATAMPDPRQRGSAHQ